MPGRNAKRNGFRKPYATIRRRFAIGRRRCSGCRRPRRLSRGRGGGATRSSNAGPAERRGLWARSAPPCAVGGVSVPPTPAGGSPQGFFGVGGPASAAVLPVVDAGEARALATADVQLAVGPEAEVADRVARVLLAPLVGDQALRRSDLAVVGRHLDPDELAADDTPVGVRPRRSRAPVVPDRRRLPRRRVVGVQEIHVPVRREARVERNPQQAAVPVVVDLGAEIGDQPSESCRPGCRRLSADRASRSRRRARRQRT